MAINIPIYRQQVQETALPNYQQRAGVLDLTPLAQGLEQAGTGAAHALAVANSEDDAAVLQDRYAKLASATENILSNPDTGVVAHKGEAALATHDQFLKHYDMVAADIGKDINPRVAKQWQAILDKQRLSFVESLDRHTAGEGEALKQQALEGAIASSNNAAVGAATRGEYDKVSEAVGHAQGAIDLAAKAGGWKPEYAEARRREAATQGYLGALDALIDQGHIADATRLLSTHRGEMDEAILAKSNIDKTLRGLGESELGARMARGFVKGSAATVMRGWDRTPIPHVDPTKAFAELAKVEADDSVPERVKAAAREHTEALVHSSEATWKATLDDVYDRAVTKLERGSKLSDLAQERDFLLADGVGGGDVWRKIKDAHENQLRHARNAPHTAAQDAAMVDFYLALPSKQAEYIANPQAFKAEWGPRLAVDDLQTAASNVSRSGVQAGRVDESLPPLIIQQVLTEGVAAGQWGAKGPNKADPNETRAYLGAMKELLAEQQKLKAKGESLDDETAKEKLAKRFAKGKVAGTGIFGTNYFEDEVTRAQFDTDPKYKGKRFIEEGQAAPVPLGDALKAVGEAPSATVTTKKLTLVGPNGENRVAPPSADLSAWLAKHPEWKTQ